jgi:hypothetical protein
VRVTEPSHMVIRDVVIISLSPQPLADDAGTLLAIGRARSPRGTMLQAQRNGNPGKRTSHGLCPWEMGEEFDPRCCRRSVFSRLQRNQTGAGAPRRTRALSQ